MYNHHRCRRWAWAASVCMMSWNKWTDEGKTEQLPFSCSGSFRRSVTESRTCGFRRSVLALVLPAHRLSPASLRLCSTLNTGQTACAVSCKVQGCGASVETVGGGGGCSGLQPRGDEESAGLSTCGPSRDSPVHTTSALWTQSVVSSICAFLKNINDIKSFGTWL